jgi:hypothetical protein
MTAGSHFPKDIKKDHALQDAENLCNRGMDYASNSLPFGFRNRLIFTAPTVEGWFLVRNNLAGL